MVRRNGTQPEERSKPTRSIGHSIYIKHSRASTVLITLSLFPALLHSHSNDTASSPSSSSLFSFLSPVQNSTFRLFFDECWFVEDQQENVLFAKLVFYIGKTDFACSKWNFSCTSWEKGDVSTEHVAFIIKKVSLKILSSHAWT